MASPTSIAPLYSMISLYSLTPLPFIAPLYSTTLYSELTLPLWLSSLYLYISACSFLALSTFQDQNIYCSLYFFVFLKLSWHPLRLNIASFRIRVFTYLFEYTSGEGGWFFIFRLFKFILFLVLEFTCIFSIYYKTLRYFVFYNLIFIG